MDYLPTIIAGGSFFLSLIFGLLGFFMKLTVDNLKERLKSHDELLDRIRDSYMKKEDFREFKDELFVRLDEFKIDVKQQIERLVEK